MTTADPTATGAAPASPDAAGQSASAHAQGAAADGKANAAQPAGQKPGDGAGSDAGKGEAGNGEGGEKLTGKPEQYESFKLSDGFEMVPEAMQEFQALAAEYDLSQSGAQKLLSAFETKIAPKIAEAQAKQFHATVEGWGKQAREDAEIGGDKFDANIRVAQTAIAQFGTPELKQLLNDYGVGNHPEVIRFCMRVGSQIGEDTMPAPGGKMPAGKSKSDTELFYGDSNHPK